MVLGFGFLAYSCIFRVVMAWRWLRFVFLAGALSAYALGGWLCLGVCLGALLTLYLMFGFYLSRLPPRFHDQFKWYAMAQAAQEKFVADGMDSETAQKEAAKEATRLFGPNPLLDPESLCWQVRRYGEKTLDRFPPEAREIYRSYWAKGPGEPRYAVLARLLAGTPGGDGAPQWEIYETCPDLQTADRLRDQLNGQAEKAGAPYRFAITALP